MKSQKIFARIAFFGLLLAGCKPVLIEQQRATATAYVQSELLKSRQAAEKSAMALCNIDIQAGKESYKEQVCEEASDLGCQIIKDQIETTWEEFTRSNTSQRLTCELQSGQLLEETRQFNEPVKNWLVKLEGKEGWPEDRRLREYWLQVSNNNGAWKLNRILSINEIRFYNTVKVIQGPE